MFHYQDSGWRQLLNRLLNQAGGWLAPSKITCLLCGASANQATGGFNGLCGACQGSIPWIADVACPVCGRPDPCGDCGRRSETYFICSRSAVRYDEGMKALLARYKYRGDERLLQLIADMLDHAYRLHVRELLDGGNPEAKQRSIFGGRKHQQKTLFDGITYVPLSEERKRERGFNQAEKLAEEIGRRHKIPVIPLLRRTRHTDKQSLKTRKERLDDLKGAFTIDKRGMALVQSIDGPHRKKRILLTDDVYTTGSTLNECAKVLHSKKIGIEIYGLMWAR